MKKLLLAMLIVASATTPAFAHLDPATHGSFMAGFSHPLFGLDHILAMVAVGLWAATLGRKATLVVPAAFVGTMALGFSAAIIGMPLPFVEPVVLASVIFVGILVALAMPLPLSGVAGTVAFFAFFHGYAHGGELGAAGALNFAVGFIVATAALHAAGIALGVTATRLLNGQRGKLFTRILGGATAIGGLYLAIGA